MSATLEDRVVQQKDARQNKQWSKLSELFANNNFLEETLSKYLNLSCEINNNKN